MRQRAFNANLHGARGLFAALVFVFHVAHSGLPTFAGVAGSWFDTYLLGSLKFGVELFFGISGYVIVGALARAPSVRAFAWDRATRIYPVLWLSLLAIIAVALATGRWLPRPGQVLLNFLPPPPFVSTGQINPAAWSLGYELTFYAMAASFWWLRQRGVRWWRVGAWLAAVPMIILFPRAILIPAGIAIALGAGSHPAITRLSRHPLSLTLVFLLLWRWIDLTSDNLRTFNPVNHPVGEWLAFLPVLLIAGALGALGLAGMAAGQGGLGRLLRTRALQRLGTMSYSFYLLHPVVMAGVKAVLQHMHAPDYLGPWSQLVFALLCLPPILLVAHWSQLLVEARLTRWLRRHGPREDRGESPLTTRQPDGAPVAPELPR